jgi:hypothetical protein
VFRLADELARGSRFDVIRVTQSPWRSGGFHTFRYAGIGLLAMGMLGGGLLAFTRGSPGSGIIFVALAVLMSIINFITATNHSVLFLKAGSMTLRRGPLPWWRVRQFALDDPITVRAQTRHVEGEDFHFLEVIVGLELARWGDFASLDDAARVAALVGREVDVRQGRAPAIPEQITAQPPGVTSRKPEETSGGTVASTGPHWSEYFFRLDAWDAVLFFAALIGGVTISLVLGAKMHLAVGIGMALGISSPRIRRHFVRIPDLTREEAAFTEPGRRLTSLALIALGATLAILGVLVTALATIIAVTSPELRYPLMVIVPLGVAVLGVVIFRYGIRVRPRG